MEAAVLVLASFFEGSLAGVSGLVRGPCFRLVGETVFFVFADGSSSFGVVEGRVSMGDD